MPTMKRCSWHGTNNDKMLLAWYIQLKRSSSNGKYNEKILQAGYRQ
jgi:hypothetical protein